MKTILKDVKEFNHINNLQTTETANETLYLNYIFKASKKYYCI